MRICNFLLAVCIVHCTHAEAQGLVKLEPDASGCVDSKTLPKLPMCRIDNCEAKDDDQRAVQVHRIRRVFFQPALVRTMPGTHCPANLAGYRTPPSLMRWRRATRETAGGTVNVLDTIVATATVKVATTMASR